MTPTRQGSFHLFRFAGIDVFLHWSWFLVAFYFISIRVGNYSAPLWNVLEYVALFGIVLLHEFGHSLACRQTGGRADKIVLWPLGGVAYVAPPPRPGATLWSIVAGPLVNVLLLPVFAGLQWLAASAGLAQTMPDLVRLIEFLLAINLIILVFNLLPVYPLDGGQILRSLLWFVMGPTRSLMVATTIGLVGAAALVLLALWAREIWLGIIAAFILMTCWQGFQEARRLRSLGAQPKHSGFACASCGTPPPVGSLWACASCGQPFDMFSWRAVCPNCSVRYNAIPCFHCGAVHPFEDWVAPPPVTLRR